MKDLKHIETPWDNKPSFLATSAQAQPKIIHCRRKHFKDSSTRTTCFFWYGCVAVGGHLASPWYSHFSSLLVSQTHLPQHFSRHTKEKHVYIKPRHFWAFLGNKRSNEIPGFSIAILKHSKTMTCDESGLQRHTIEDSTQELLLNTVPRCVHATSIVPCVAIVPHRASWCGHHTIVPCMLERTCHVLCIT